MNSLASQVGIDVSKDYLDISIDKAKPFRVPNDARGIAKLAGVLPPAAQIHLEASGGYERLVRTRLTEAGFTVETHCPLKVRRMAQAKARHGKTDALDAKHLAEVGQDLPSQPHKSAEHESLTELSRAISELKTQAGQMKVRAKTPQLDLQLKKVYLAVATSISKKVAILEKTYLKRIQASSFAERFDLARSIDGVGAGLARVAVSELPEDLESFTPAQICSYAGLAPIDHQSGSSRRPSRIGHGNARLKGALYMPALYCVQRQDWARSLYRKLRERGRAHQQAIVAVMRRLLRRLVAVLRRGSAWVAEPPTAKAPMNA